MSKVQQSKDTVQTGKNTKKCNIFLRCLPRCVTEPFELPRDLAQIALLETFQSFSIYAFILLLIIVVAMISVLSFKIVSWIFDSNVITLVLFSLGWFVFLRTVIVLAAFPGCFGVFRKMVEINFCSDYADKLCQHAINIQKCIKNFNEDDENLVIDQEHLDSFKNIITAFNTCLNDHIDVLNKIYLKLDHQQKELADLLTTISKQMKSLDMPSDDSIPLQSESCLQKDTDYVSNYKHYQRFKVQDRPQLDNLLCNLQKLQQLLSKYLPTLTLFKMAKLIFLSGKPLIGDAVYHRAHLKLKYNAQQFWVTSSKDKARIDCMIVPAYSSDKLDTAAPCVIFCSPNAVFYEFILYTQSWTRYYLNIGVNVVVWNVRGYGRSQLKYNCINPRLFELDSIDVHKFVRENYAHGKIGVHSESLGGIVASHLLSECQPELDFVCINRTFSSLKAVGFWALKAKLPQFIYDMLAFVLINWQDKNWKKYMKNPNSKTYKVFGQDVLDGIIPDMASLKNSICEQLVLKQQRNIENNEGVHLSGYWCNVKDHLLWTEKQHEIFVNDLIDLLQINLELQSVNFDSEDSSQYRGKLMSTMNFAMCCVYAKSSSGLVDSSQNRRLEQHRILNKYKQIDSELQTDLKSLSKLIKLLPNILMLRQFEAGGKYLEYIFTNQLKVLKEPNRQYLLQQMKMFWINLEVLGCQRDQHYVNGDELFTHKDGRMQAIERLKDVVSGLDRMIKQFKNDDTCQTKGQLFTQIVFKLEKVQQYFEKIYQVFNSRLQNYETRINSDVSSLKCAARNLDNCDFIDEPSEDISGHFLNLQCGHNDWLSQREMITFEKHLLASRFITDRSVLLYHK